jgi:hypothetical protein
VKIGKDEIGVFGGVGILLLFIGMFVAVYNLLQFGGLGLVIVGMSLFVAGFLIYYADLFEHRRRKQQATVEA